MSGQIQPGPTLLPGEPRYEALAEAFGSGNLEKLKALVHPLAALLPMIPEKERTSFRDSLSTGQNHAVVFHLAKLLDGRNRVRELTQLRKPISTAVFVGTNLDALNFVKAENIERRHLNESQRADFAARIATAPLGANQHTKQGTPIGAAMLPLGNEGVAEEVAGLPQVSQGEAADSFNVSRRSVQRATVYQEKGVPELSEAVQAGKMAVSTAADIAESLPPEEQKQLAQMSEADILAKAKEIRKKKNDDRRAVRVEKIKEKAAGNSELSTAKKFPVIYMDPPTKFAAGDSDRSTENHYPTMTEEEIAALPISDLALEDAVLFIWTTVPWLRKTIRLIEGWGFEYVSEYVWDKEHMSLGFWARNQHETLLVATRGKIPAPDPSLVERSLYREDRRDHSAKPAFFRDMIGRYYPDLPKVELFPRGTLPEGWHGWGNEARLTKQQELGIDGNEEQAA